MNRIIDGHGLWRARLLVFDALPSTNQWALDNADACLNGDVVWARRQTSGRGRFNRKWFAPEDRCLTLSFVLKPETTRFENAVIPLIGQLGALAVRSTLETFAIPAKVKWPNDVMVNDKKIAGILSERDSGTGGAVVMGIGLNVNAAGDDLDINHLMQPATSMAIETKRAFEIEEVRDAVIAQVELKADVAEREGGSFIVREWKANDAFYGRNVEVRTCQDTVMGAYMSVDETGRLRLIDATGRERVFLSGDVSLCGAT